MNDNSFTVNINGKSQKYDVIKICKYNNEDYIIYKDDYEYFSSRYKLNNGNLILEEIIDNSAWDYLDKELGDCIE